MKREAVQEERHRGSKMPQKQADEINQTNPVHELTIERLLEAEQKTETGGGTPDHVIPYLRVGPNSVVQSEYKVNCFFYEPAGEKAGFLINLFESHYCNEQ